METWLLIVGLAALVGAALVIIGWRGRRLDDHPLCRRCGFDLTGRAPDSTRCSECGVDVTRPRAIRIGHRRRRFGVLFGGLALMLPSLLIVGAVMVVRARGVDLTPYKPDWLLAREVTTGDPASAKSLPELTRRVGAGTVSDAYLAAVADACLGWQGEENVRWDPQWGRFIEMARNAGKLSDERWARYAGQAFVSIRLTSRRPWPEPWTTVALSANDPRVASAKFVAFFDWDRLRLDDEPPRELWDFALSPPKPAHGCLPAGWHLTPRLNGPATPLPPGPHTFRTTLRLRVYDAKDASQAQPPNAAEPDPSMLVARLDRELALAVTLPKPVKPVKKLPATRPRKDVPASPAE